jgi:hypothetical protein
MVIDGEKLNSLDKNLFAAIFESMNRSEIESGPLMVVR